MYFTKKFLGQCISSNDLFKDMSNDGDRVVVFPIRKESLQRRCAHIARGAEGTEGDDDVKQVV